MDCHRRVWGGVTRPERTKALRQVAAEMAADGKPISLWSPIGSDVVSSSLGRDPRNSMDHAELVERTAQALEAGFEARLELWRSRRPGWRACEVCGTAFEIPPNERRPKQYCSLSCRQRAYYRRRVQGPTQAVKTAQEARERLEMTSV